jgi:hypothetical protein
MSPYQEALNGCELRGSRRALVRFLSANPLGVTVLPLFLIGLAIYANRELISGPNSRNSYSAAASLVW